MFYTSTDTVIQCMNLYEVHLLNYLHTLVITLDDSRDTTGLHVPTVHSVIGVSLSLEPESGTVSRPLCAQLTCPLNGSNGH